MATSTDNNIIIPPCAGIIVINNDKTVLVSTKMGNLSFPKGKRHKNETTYDTAWRELTEETGIDSSHVDLIADYYIDEISRKGFVSVRYFVGILKKTATFDDFKFDPEELSNVAWYNIIDALESTFLKENRKDILLKVWTKIENNN